ncbi:hypothetical protein H920_08616 [Fukomys damarensis]|uniref:Uncharacterized protein n=1 Tax=Fukomys damarensis TaxID=885580 RepID=A0A091DHM6_FUKDA|nr:hypothetical protein H920_08616 [Fukomys damarensis]
MAPRSPAAPPAARAISALCHCAQYLTFAIIRKYPDRLYTKHFFSCLKVGICSSELSAQAYLPYTVLLSPVPRLPQAIACRHVPEPGQSRGLLQYAVTDPDVRQTVVPCPQESQASCAHGGGPRLRSSQLAADPLSCAAHLKVGSDVYPSTDDTRHVCPKPLVQ